MVATETLLAGALAVLVGALTALHKEPWSPWHGVAATAIAFPVAEDLVGFIQIAPLIGRPTVLDPLSAGQLARIPVRTLRNNLGIPALGLALVALAGAVPVAKRHLKPLWPGWPEFKQELTLGWALAPLIILAEATALALLAGPASFLQTGDESALFANATWRHVLLLSLVPALAEEIYYRGLLQGLLEHLYPSKIALHGAILTQGLLFGLAHGGYTTLAHVLGPLLFGTAMGYLRSMGGLGACVIAHASANLLYFSIDPGAGSTTLQAAVLLLGTTGLLALWFARRTLRARLRSGPRMQPPP